MAASCCYRLCSACSHSSASSLPTALMRGRSSTRRLPKSCPFWKPRSSNARIKSKALSSCQNAGLLNEPSVGSIVAAGSPKIGKISIVTPLRFSNSRPSASCCENYAILDIVSGRTLREGLTRFSHTAILSGSQFFLDRGVLAVCHIGARGFVRRSGAAPGRWFWLHADAGCLKVSCGRLVCARLHLSAAQAIANSCP